jgi:hypothetical protein
MVLAQKETQTSETRINLHIFRRLILTKAPKEYLRESTASSTNAQMVLGKLDIKGRYLKLDPHLTLYKIKLKMDQRPK